MMQMSKYVRHMIENDMDFNQFVWACTDASGSEATVEFYEEKLKEAKELYQVLNDMTLTDRIAYGKRIKDERLYQYKLRAEEELFNISKCEDMLAKVHLWEPPTPNHIDLKHFMIEQLTQSIGTGISYYEGQIKELEKVGALEIFEKDFMSAKTRILCMEENLMNEIEATRERKEWVAALTESIGAPHAVNP